MKKPDGFTKESSQIAKGVGILWLLFFHLFAEEGVLDQMAVSYRPFTEDGFRMVAAFGKICVAIFVVLSSYGISLGAMKDGVTLKDLSGQALKRFFKLMGGFAALYISVIIVFFFRFDLVGLYGRPPQGLILLLTDALGFAETMGTPTLNMTWWYMSVAYALILFVPVITYVTKRLGYWIIPVSIFIPVMFSVSSSTKLYLFSATIGIAAAYGDWFNRLLKIKIHIVIKWVVGITVSAASVLIRYNTVIDDYFLPYADALIAVFIIWTAAELIASIPVLREGIWFVGKHSLNIFLVHTFFYMIVLRDVVYHFSPAGVTYLILLAMSLGYSVVLELLKHFIVMGYKTLRGGKEVTNE